MSLKNTSLFGVILTLLLTFGVGEMWGASEGSTWRSASSANVYFDNTNSSYANVSMLIGRQWNYSSDAKGSWGENFTKISGTNNLYWTNVTFSLNSEGIQTLLWTYHKDGADAAGEDCAWVANVVITYAQEPEIRFTSISVEEGAVTVAVSMMVGETPQNISSTEVKNWLEATSDLSDWVGGRLPITVTDLTEDVAETVRFRVTFTDGAPPRAFLRIRKP